MMMMVMMMALIGIIAARYCNCRGAQHHIRCIAGGIAVRGTRNGT